MTEKDYSLHESWQHIAGVPPHERQIVAHAKGQSRLPNPETSHCKRHAQ